MPLSNKLRRLALLMELDIERMLERHAQRTAGHDEARLDDRTRLVTYLRRGAIAWQAEAETIGEWAPELGSFRWWFAGRVGPAGKSRLDVAHHQLAQHALPELTTDVTPVETEQDAVLLARLIAQLCRGDGVLRTSRSGAIVFHALFDASAREPQASEVPDSRLRDTAVTSPSERPPWIPSDAREAATDGPPPFPVGGARTRSFSIAPPSRVDAREAFGVASLAPPRASEPHADATIPRPPKVPSIAPPVREPARDLLLPIAQAALGEIARVHPGFSQAMLVVRVEVDPHGKGRFFVQLVAIDAAGDLVSLDPSRALLDAAAKMIGDDARAGNARWRKLVARMRPTSRGASVDVEVV